MEDYEHDGYAGPAESKGFKIVKGIFKGLLFGASAVVWLLIFWVIISTREPSFYEKMIFTDQTRKAAEETENYEVCQLHVRTWMNYDNSISVSNVWYSVKTGELEIGFRYNTKLLRTSDGNGRSITTSALYSLTGDDGLPLQVSNVTRKTIGRYEYFRVCFSGVSLNLDPDVESPAGFSTLRLAITRESDGEPLSSYTDKEGTIINDAEFVIYDSKTVVQRVPYDP